MYAQVVVLTFQPPEINTYTYKVPKNLDVKIGQLVSVPFGKRTPMGVVVEVSESREERKEEIKSISSIVLKEPVLLPHQIKLLNWMAAYWHAPMVNCLEAMIPKLPTTRTGLALYPTTGTKSVLATGQTIVLAPSINHLPETIAKFKAKNFIVYHGEQKPLEKFSNWQKIKTGTFDFVFGTRSAIFTPCPDLKKIIIFEEHEEGYRSERSPYYKTLTVAEKLQELTSAKLEITDSAPKVATYFAHRVDLSTKTTPPKVKVVNMLAEKQAGNRSPISSILEDYIARGVKIGKKILLFLNKKKESGHIFCRNCKYSGFEKKQPEICPNCQSPDIYFSSTNINSLSILVKKIAPDIDVATAAVFYKLMMQKYDLVAHIATDSLANIADFSSSEKLFAQITNLKKITRGLLLLQTYNPQDPTINAAAFGNFQKFFQDQIRQRKALSYPPFCLMVKLSIKGKKEEGLEQKAQALHGMLSDTSSSSSIKILGPYKPIFVGKAVKYNIILKIATDDYSLKSKENALQITAPHFAKIPKNWQVEVEPENL